MRNLSPTAAYVATVGTVLLVVASVAFIALPSSDPLSHDLGLAVASLAVVTVGAKLYQRGRETGWQCGAEDVVHDFCTDCGQEVKVSLRHRAGCASGIRYEEFDVSHGARIGDWVGERDTPAGDPR